MNLGLAIADGLEAALAVFRLRATAGWLFAFMAVCCVSLCALYFQISIAPAKRALAAASRALRGITFVQSQDRAGSEREREHRLDMALTEAGHRSAAGRRLLIAWRRRLAALHAGLPGGEDPIVRPAHFLGPNPRWLSTAADAFVGVGLVFTFLGLVAALGAASATIASTQGDGRDALLELLGAASVKFFTSIAGIGGALVMRVWQAYWLSQIATRCADLSTAVDAHLTGLGAPGAPGGPKKRAGAA